MRLVRSVLVREGGLNFARQRGDEFPEPVHVFLFNDILLACRNASQLPPQYSSLMTEPAPAAKPFIYLVRNLLPVSRLFLCTTSTCADLCFDFPLTHPQNVH